MTLSVPSPTLHYQEMQAGITWKRPPFEHQRTMALFHYYHPFSGSFSDVGVAKTYPVIACLARLIARGAVRKALVVCTNTIKDNWMNELRLGSNLSAVILEGSRAERLELLRQPAEAYIINYDGARILRDELMQIRWDAIVVDECHAIKNPNAKVTKALLALAPSARWRVAITATPYLNDLLDLWSIFQFIDPKIFKTNYWGFRSRFMVNANAGKSWMKFPDWKPKPGAIEEIKRIIAPYVVSYKKSEVNKHLPPLLFTERKVELTGDQQTAYDQIRRDFLLELRSGNVMPLPNILSRISKLLQVASGFVYHDSELKDGAITPKSVQRFGSNAKLEELRAVLEEIGDRGVIIWCAFKEDLKLVSEAIPGSAVIGGDTAPEDRQPIIDQVNSGEVRVLVANPAVAGEGLTILVPYMVWYSRSWKLKERVHGLGRTQRPGAEKFENLTVIDLTARGTIDERVLSALAGKEDVLEQIKSGRVEEMV